MAGPKRGWARRAALRLVALFAVGGAAFAVPAALSATNASAGVRTDAATLRGTGAHPDAAANLLGAYAALSPNPAAPPPPAIPTALLVPAAAPPPPPAADTPGSIGAAALASIHYPYEKLGYQIEFLAPRSGYLGMTYCSQHLIQVYVNPGESVGTVSFITAFEMAHAVDCTYNTAGSRVAWAEVRGFSTSAAWFPPCSCSEDNYGSGDFADVFATWLQGPQWWKWRSNLAASPSPDQLMALMPELEPAGLFG